MIEQVKEKRQLKDKVIIVDTSNREEIAEVQKGLIDELIAYELEVLGVSASLWTGE